MKIKSSCSQSSQKARCMALAQAWIQCSCWMLWTQ